MASKIDKTDAQEWLESLQQIGEGWYRQVALAIKAGAHKPLGLTEREFARTIGQRMIDPLPAIVDLHREDYSANRIANVLGMSPQRVHNLLVQAGEIEGDIKPTGSGDRLSDKNPKARKALAAKKSVTAQPNQTGKSVPSQTDQQIADLQAEVEILSAQVDQRDQQFINLQEKSVKTSRELREYKRRIKELEEAPTEKERERIRKEVAAWAEEEQNKILAGMSHLVVNQVVGGLEDATEGLVELRNRQAVTPDVVAAIERAHSQFTNELGLTKMTVSEGR